MIESSSIRDELLNLVTDIPVLSQSKMANADFTFPNLQRTRSGSPRKTRLEADVAAKVDSEATEATAFGNPIERLFLSVRRAASKLEFGKTPINTWHESLVFFENRTKRNSKERRFETIHPTSTSWKRGEYVNLSRSTTNDWFLNHLIPMLVDGGGFRHSHAVIGAPGCGKSTLVKYLMSENATSLRRSNLVFSRFEFLKFLKEWRKISSNIDEALAAYLSFIHARDLVLDHFFQLENGCRFEVKMKFRSAKALEDELIALTKELEILASQIGLQPSEATDKILSETFSRARLGNEQLMSWLRAQSTKMRILLIGTLWHDKCLVTVFDGLDSLRVEDAFRQSAEWDAVCHIIGNREALSAPTQLRALGMAQDSDSLVIVRNNTARYLETEFPSRGKTLGFSHIYEVGNLDGLTAMVNVVDRATKYVPDIKELSENTRRTIVFETMKIVQRTMVAIGRGHGASIKAQLIYDFFDGNLRQLFRFVSRLIRWKVQEMLRSGFLDSNDYFSDTATLVRAVASEKGNQFLRRKSYRIVEILLFEDHNWFENAAAVQYRRGPLLNLGNGGNKHIVGNPDFEGQIDNVFNYISVRQEGTVDAHALLEKVRVIQVLQKEPISDSELERVLFEEFGYVPEDLELLIRFLLKTDFISAEIVRQNMVYEVQLRATTRGKLCIHSLIKNLAYIEHVFHRTLFPTSLVSHVADKPRNDKNRLKWAAASIRNAFIFLTYLRHVEQNPAGGKHVPEKYQLYDALHRNILASLERMTKPGALPTGGLEGTEQSREGAKTICREAIVLIKETLDIWATDDLLLKPA